MRSLSERIDSLAADADDLAPYFEDDDEDDPPGTADSARGDENVHPPWGPSPILEAKLAALEAEERNLAHGQPDGEEDTAEAAMASPRSAERPLPPDAPRGATDDFAPPPEAPIDAPGETAEPETTDDSPARPPTIPTVAAAGQAAAATDPPARATEPVVLPRPVAGRRRNGRIFTILALAALIAVAFVAGSWWAGRDRADDAVAAPDEAAAGTPQDLTSATPPAEPADEPGAGPEEATSETQAGTAGAESEADEDPTTTAVALRDPDVVVAEATTALAAAGYPDIAASYDDGTLVLAGVIPADLLMTGYFGQLDTIASVVADLDGVGEVVPRLYLRGDDVSLRRQLTAIAEENPIEFDLASAELTDGARAALRDAAEVILANPGLRVLVAGHTDASGTADANAALAIARSAAVIEELVALGVPITRLQPVAYGELFPDEASTDAENRRVAFEVAP